MPSRQDQLHSYQFSVQRVVAALVMRETDPAQSPFRRVAGATMAGAIVAALALAGAALYGLSAGGSGNWEQTGQVIIEKESGTRYVYYKGDGKLHPVMNYASALLIADAPNPTVVTWSRSALDKAARGAPMGIAGAPDSLPDVKRLIKAPWMLCSQRPPDNAGTTRPQSVLAVGGTAQGGRALIPAGGASGPETLLVSTPDGKRYLVYDNRRYLLAQPDQVMRAFAWTKSSILPVSPGLLNALPPGPDLRLIPIQGRPGNSLGVPGAKIGQVYTSTTAGGAQQYAVALADGLASITEAQADLLLADPEAPISPDGRPTDLPAAAYALAKPSKTGLAVEPPFKTPPAITDATGSLCVSVPDASGVKKFIIDANMTGPTTATPARTATGALLADRVGVPAGHAALVEAVASPGASSGGLSVVTDLGIRYPLASRDLVAKLGYEGVTPVRMPAELVALLPVGPTLDPAAATNSASS
jgi:type VII secretion protein EccB